MAARDGVYVVQCEHCAERGEAVYPRSYAATCDECGGAMVPLYELGTEDEDDRAACCRCDDDADFDKGDGLEVPGEGWLCPNCADAERADQERGGGGFFIA